MTRKALLIECKEVTRDRLTLSARGLHQASGKMQFSVTAGSIMHVPRRESDDANRRFRGRSEQATGFRRNGWSACVGISGRHGSEYAASNQDRSPTQQTERNAPSPDSSCERFHEELLWCFREHRPRWVVMRISSADRRRSHESSRRERHSSGTLDAISARLRECQGCVTFR